MDTILSFKGHGRINAAPIQEHLASCEKPFEMLQMYSSKRQEKFIDTDLQNSTFRTMTDSKLILLVEDIVRQINDEQQKASMKSQENNQNKSFGSLLMHLSS